MSASLRSPIGPNHIEWGEFHFIAPEPGDTAADLDEHDENGLVTRYCLRAVLQIGKEAFPILPSAVALCRELISGMKAITRGEATTMYLVEDGEFSLQLAPARVGSEIYHFQLAVSGRVLSTWNESIDRALFEFSAILQAQSLRCAEANIRIEELLKRCRGQVGWSCEE